MSATVPAAALWIDTDADRRARRERLEREVAAHEENVRRWNRVIRDAAEELYAAERDLHYAATEPRREPGRPWCCRLEGLMCADCGTGNCARCPDNPEREPLDDETTDSDREDQER